MGIFVGNGGSILSTVTCFGVYPAGITLDQLAAVREECVFTRIAAGGEKERALALLDTPHAWGKPNPWKGLDEFVARYAWSVKDLMERNRLPVPAEFGRTIPAPSMPKVRLTAGDGEAASAARDPGGLDAEAEDFLLPEALERARTTEEFERGWGLVTNHFVKWRWWRRVQRIIDVENDAASELLGKTVARYVRGDFGYWVLGKFIRMIDNALRVTPRIDIYAVSYKNIFIRRRREPEPRLVEHHIYPFLQPRGVRYFAVDPFSEDK